MLRTFSKLAATCLIGATSTYAAHAQDTLADCGASVGQSMFLSPLDTGWVPDQISKGRIRITADGRGNPNVIHTDATGLSLDAAADGGRIMFTRLDTERGEFGVLVVYASTGVVESYNVSTAPGGTRRLLWTSNKPRVDGSGLIKVGAYAAPCS